MDNETMTTATATMDEPASAAETQPPTDAKAAAAAKLARLSNDLALMMGQIVGLMARSPDHKHLFLADLEWRVLPPMLLRQCRVIHKAGLPVAFVSWALLSEEVEKRFLATPELRLKPEDWKSGDRPWIVDLIAPRGGEKDVLDLVSRKALGGRAIKARQRGTDTNHVGAPSSQP